MANKDNYEKESVNIRFHHTKSNFFRVIHADGLTGSVTPRGDIFVCFYSERLPIPDSVVLEVSKDGNLLGEIPEETVTTTKGVVRELEAGIVVDINNAKGMLNLLNTLVARLESQIETEDEEIDYEIQQ